MKDKLKHISIIVSGIVQGVGFRYSALQAAKSFSVNGYVENLQDGRVMIEAEGNEENVNAMLEWVKEGPPRAKVRDIDIMDKKPEYYSRFEIR